MPNTVSSTPVTGRPERRVAINSGLLLGAGGFQAAVSVVIVGLVARYLGQAGLGRYGYVISFIELFVAFIDLGMNRILVREISRRLEEADRFTSAIWTLRLVLAAIALGIVAITATGDGRELWLAVVIYYLAQTAFVLADVFNSTFHGFQRMEYQFWGVNVSQVLLLALTVAAVQLDLGLVGLFGARLAANLVKLAYVWWVSQRHFARAHFMWAVFPGAVAGLLGLPRTWRTHPWRPTKTGSDPGPENADHSLGERFKDARLAWQMLLESVPVGISLILRSYIWRGGVVLTVLWMGQQQGDLINGLLYGPLRVVQQMRIVPAAFTAAMLPVFSNRAVTRIDEFDSAFAKSIKLFTAMGLLIALAFTLLAKPIVAILLGGDIDLAGAGQVLTLLGWVIVLYFPNWLFGVTLVTLGRQRLETAGLALGLLAGYLVARWGIPQWGALGVSWAILAAEGAFFLVGVVAMWKHFRWRRLALPLAKIIAACAAAGVVFGLGDRLWRSLAIQTPALDGNLGIITELVVVGCLGLAVFGASLALLKAFDADEVEGIKVMLRPRRDRK